MSGDAKSGESFPTGQVEADIDWGELLERGKAGDVELIRADKLIPEAADWLWPGYIAAGKLHILAGVPSTGKTTIALSFAATVTRGSEWPDGTRCTAGDVLIWSGEDNLRDTLLPRLIAAGADVSRVHFVGDVTTSSDGLRPFDPAADFKALEYKAETLPSLRLVIVDPIVSAVRGDSHKNAEVRRGLQPLVTFADKTRAAVIGVSHFSKGTAGRDVMDRVTGSLAFSAIARIVLATAKAGTGEDDQGRVLVRAKSNLGPEGGGFRYQLQNLNLPAPHEHIPTSRVVWSEPMRGDAREILAEIEAPLQGDRMSAVGRAEAFLIEALSEGPEPARNLEEQAKAHRVSKRTLVRAKQSLGVLAYKDGMNGPWLWALPSKNANFAERGQAPELASFEKFGILRSGEDSECDSELL